MPQLSFARLPRDARHRRLAVSLVTVALLFSATPSPAATQKELDQARAERQAVQKDLDKTVAAYNAAQAQLAKTQASIKANQAALEEAETTARIVQHRMDRRADAIYRRGPVALFQYLFNAQTLGDFGRRLTLIEAASSEDALVLAHANKSRADIARLNADLEQQGAREQKLLSDMSAQTSSLSASFGKARDLETRLVADREAALRVEAERKAKAAAEAAARAKAEEDAKKKAADDAKKKAAAQAKASPGPAAKASPSPSAARAAEVPLGVRTMRCPVDGPTSFTDTYGDPRSGGRAHQGVDMYAAMGTPAAAIVDGSVLRKASSGAGGISLYYTGNDGNEYFYAHLSKYADISPGQKMSAGDHVGFVGDSGNAQGGPPHLHFEVRPQGGAPINPTPTARRACG
jgi:septal ring factor EnvC (AmiA/AmiB activator)